MNYRFNEIRKETAYAKINLWLEVLNKRCDGYHNIRSVMQSVSFCDTVDMSLTDSEITMTSSDPSLSCDDRNLCIKAAKAFLKATKINIGLQIHLDKNIFVQAGLGGGSSDAAAVLRGINYLCGSPLSIAELCEIGKKLGADIPFCIVGGAAVAQGIGEILTDCPKLPDCKIVICEGAGKVSTPEAYRIIDEIPSSCINKFSDFIFALNGGDLSKICSFLYNRFEDTLPESGDVKQMLLNGGAIGALMTGSGSAVYGIFDSEEQANKTAILLRERGLNCVLCKPI